MSRLPAKQNQAGLTPARASTSPRSSEEELRRSNPRVASSSLAEGSHQISLTEGCPQSHGSRGASGRERAHSRDANWYGRVADNDEIGEFNSPPGYTDNVKTCNACGEIKPLTEFHKAKGTTDGLRKQCRACVHTRWKDWYEKSGREAQQRNAGRNAIYRKTEKGQIAELRKRLSKYNLNEQQYADLWFRSKGVCEICLNRPGTQIDHDHDTGAIRGLLCGPCNRGLGIFLDSTALLQQAVRYLTLRG